MNKKRAFAFIALLCAFVFLISSCDNAQNKTEDVDDGLTIVATIFPQYDFARAIVGDLGTVTMMMSPESESHTYEPSLRDIADVEEADIFIYTGSGIDTWAEDIAALFGDEIISVSTADAVTLIMDDDGDEYDEHIWTSPKNAKSILSLILEAIVKADPDNAETYRQRAAEYEEQLDALDEELQAVSEELSDKTVVIADRFPFKYLFDEYEINYIAALDGCSSDSEPSPSVIAEMITTVSDGNIPYIYIVEFSEGKTASLISEATGCNVLTLHSCHNVSNEDFDAGVTYIDIMRQNVENLRLLAEG